MTSAPAAPAQILVVDDNEMNRDVLTRRLEKQGHAVTQAEGGRVALDRLRAAEFDLVLLDVMMPGMDGKEVLASLKADSALSHIPVVMISASEEIETVVRCIELGAEDYLPKPFNPTILKARVGACLEKKRLRDAERKWARSLERELEIGREIQSGFFPESLPRPAGYEIAARFQPARQCAGDFYDAFDLSAGRAGVVVADVCDKGVGAALFMALFRSLIRSGAERSAASGSGAEEILRSAVVATNDYIAGTHSRANMFATIFFAILDAGSGRLDYVNAGHEAPAVLRAGAIAARLPPGGPAVGLLPGMEFTVGSLALRPGDTLFAFTDGVTDAKGPEGFFGESRLLELVARPSSSAEALLEGVEAELARHVGGETPYDDVTLLALRRG